MSTMTCKLIFVSLPHALIGLLAVEPRTGYELTKYFDVTLGRYAWQAGHTSIYPELTRLAERGIVFAELENPQNAEGTGSQLLR